MKKHMLSMLLALALLLNGCAGTKTTQYSATFLTLFDTVTTIVGTADSEEDFNRAAQAIYDELLRYHQLFDTYNDYPGLNNLKTVNDNAGIAPVAVDSAIIELLTDCRDYWVRTDGRVNVAMGSVLALWHEAREAGIENPQNARLPEKEALREAANHSSWDTVVIDEKAGTVYLADPAQRLDVGAVAKGWATQRVAENAPAGLLLSVGGNVCATGPKDEQGTAWVVGITNPDGSGNYLHTLKITSGSVVTSGDYQRYYTVDGRMYHHIIDPDTLYPAEYWRSVTVLCPDSGLADALSTALFLLPLEEGLALAKSCKIEAMWVDGDGNFYYSEEFENFIRN